MWICYRYDYENCESGPAEKMMADLDNMVLDALFIGKTFTHGDKTFKVAKADNYGYTDPIDGSVSKKQVTKLQSVPLNSNSDNSLVPLIRNIHNIHTPFTRYVKISPQFENLWNSK